MAATPHFTLPFQWVSTGAGTVAAQACEQESTTEIAACCEAIIRTVQGQRTTLPDFGRPQLEFNTHPELVQAALAQALRDFEPRVESLISTPDITTDPEVQIVRALIAPLAEDTELA